MSGKELSGRVALVTGGGSGIGVEICRGLSAMGAAVAIADLNLGAAEALAAEIAENGGHALAVRLDVSDPQSVGAAVAQVEAELGPLSLCANNAGIVAPRRPLAEIRMDEWSSQMAVNLSGVFHCLQVEIPALLRAGGGAIVNTSSLCGQVGVAGVGAYCAAKHGVIGLTKVAALDYATQGIRVNAVAPGYVDTPILSDRGPEERASIANRHPVERMAQPREIADVICFLLSDRASFVTGATYDVDGGFTAR